MLDIFDLTDLVKTFGPVMGLILFILYRHLQDLLTKRSVPKNTPEALERISDSLKEMQESIDILRERVKDDKPPS